MNEAGGYVPLFVKRTDEHAAAIAVKCQCRWHISIRAWAGYSSQRHHPSRGLSLVMFKPVYDSWAWGRHALLFKGGAAMVDSNRWRRLSILSLLPHKAGLGAEGEEKAR
jgi:hypothetical protein